MTARRVLMIGLDGYDPSLADGFIAEGKLPALKRLRDEGAWFYLDHGEARRTGLAWEHVASGQSPDAAGKWSAVEFDPATYSVVQRHTMQTPFTAYLPGKRTIVFDTPYFDLGRVPNAVGVVGWGAHDPGVAQWGQPHALLGEILEKFGRYSAPDWIYAFVWNSEKAANAMADDLIRATEQRSRIVEWLLRDRYPDWDLGFVTFSEFHSALEAMWHGVDPTHPLSRLASAGAARRCVVGVYEAVDRFLARAAGLFPDTTLVAFNLHGMGANEADVPSMVLLPELMYRHAFGKSMMGKRTWRTTPAGVPLLDERETWDGCIDDLYANPLTRVAGRISRKLSRHFGADDGGGAENSIRWMPSTKYRSSWPDMRAFAFPSYYDGQIRINLQGREARGIVPLAGYEACCDEIEALLSAITNPLTGEPAVASIHRTRKAPLSLTGSEVDFVIHWRPATLGFSHPAYGDIGPLPYRRTGGHTGGHGAVYIAGTSLHEFGLHGFGLNGFGGVRSAFDVVPTIFDLLGVAPPSGISGRSLLPGAT